MTDNPLKGLLGRTVTIVGYDEINGKTHHVWIEAPEGRHLRLSIATHGRAAGLPAVGRARVFPARGGA